MSFRKIAENSFYQLILIYSLIILIISLGFISKYTLHFEILAIILAILGLGLLEKDESVSINKNLHLVLFILAIILIISFRVLPYLNNSIPLGYDAGLYKYAIEHGLVNQDKWILSGMEPGFLYLMSFFKLFLSSSFILIPLFILFNILLGLAIYFFTKQYFSKKAAIISMLLYSLSIIQFKVFTYMYYKNILALSLMLFAFYFLKSKKYSQHLFILFSVLTAWIHRPTFYILGLSYFFYSFISPYNVREIKLHPLGCRSCLATSDFSEHPKVPNKPHFLECGKTQGLFDDKKYSFSILKNNIINGVIILILSSLFYLGKFMPAITSIFFPVLNSFTNTGTSPGTFISFSAYQLLTLSYLPFAILGLFYLIKNKHFNILFYWTIINASIVYFQFFFFNRFIIHLDIALIILASVSLAFLLSKRKYFIFILLVLLFSSAYLTFQASITSKPLISEDQLSLIQQLNQTEANSQVISISSDYSPWVLAYSQRRTIAPGLFDYNQWSVQQWQEFWQGNNIQELMSSYSKPIYLFAGNKPFNATCFSLYLAKGDNRIFKYDC